MSNNDDTIVGDLLKVAVLGLAAYGAYKLVQNLNRTSEQRLLEHLGRDLRAIDAGYDDDMLEIDYDGGDDEDDE